MRNDVLETIEYRGFKINIHSDQDCMNPLTEWEHPKGFLFFTSTRRDSHHYWVGEYEDGPDVDIDNFLRAFAENTNPEWDSHYWLPIYKYDHSGVMYSNSSFNDRWDSGLVGLVAIPKSTAKKEWPEDTEESAYKYMRSITETFSDWANGDCFGYTIEGPDGSDIDDSCWGFIGVDDRDNYMVGEAKATIDYEIKSNPDYFAMLWRRAVADEETELGFEDWKKLQNMED